MNTSARDGDVFAHARSIADLTEAIQRVNYRMLERLRPLVLEQAGVVQALQQLIASWQARCPHVTWSVDLPPDFNDPDEVVALTLYRTVQEAITNAVRHAQASAIGVQLVREPAGKLVLSVRDNGRGRPETFRYGFGLLGMTERIRHLGGTLNFQHARPGVALEVTIPDHEQWAMEEAGAGLTD
jgi:two-component system sensor histidine kinase UhpB